VVTITKNMADYFDKIQNIASITISNLNDNWGAALAIIALFATIIQTRYMQKYNNLSVMPAIGTFSERYTGSEEYDHTKTQCFIYNVILTNSGLGPANVIDYTVLHDDKILSHNDNDLAIQAVEEKVKKFKPRGKSLSTAYTKGGTFPKGLNQSILTIIIPKDDVEESEFIKFTKKLTCPP